MDKNSYFIRTRGSTFQGKTKGKFLFLLLKRMVNNKLATYFNKLKNNSNSYKKKLEDIRRISKINLQACKIIAWQKIKLYYKYSKSKQRILKDAFNIIIRIKNIEIKNYFLKLKKKCLPHLNQATLSKIVKAKKKIMFNSIKKLYYKSLGIGFEHLRSNMIKQRQKKKIRSINIITKNIYERNLRYGWLSLLSLKITNQRKQNQKFQDINYQIQDMKIQLQNKNNNIFRLQQQINQLKQNIKKKDQKGDSFVFNSSTMRSKTNSFQKSLSKQNQSFQKDSNRGSVHGQKINFFAQLLGIPNLTMKSNSHTNILTKNNNPIQQCICINCNYLQKYEKNKLTNETLKKQYQLIKKQLQFTKDINQNLQQQIHHQLYNQQKQQKLQSIKNQIKQCIKDKQNLKDKVYKHQKYIKKLKQQFKFKIQQLYRKIKKCS